MDTEHFLKADCLSTELDFISTVGLGFAAFVFDRQHGVILLELNDVALAGETEFERADRHAASDADAGTGFIRSVMRAFVKCAAFGREAVLGPRLLDMDERALARAVEPVLEC